jgi:hypothetical protein
MMYQTPPHTPSGGAENRYGILPLPHPRHNGGLTTTNVNGVEVYTEKKALGSIKNARCLCPMVASSGKTVNCSECHEQFHAKCHQLVALTPSVEAEWMCTLCRSKTFDPFRQVEKTLFGPQYIRFTKFMSPYGF